MIGYKNEHVKETEFLRTKDDHQSAKTASTNCGSISKIMFLSMTLKGL